MLSPAISRSSATQKIGVSHRLHPFPDIPLQGVIWRFNSQKQLLHTLSLPLIPTSRLLQQDNSVFPTCHYPLSNLLCITLILGCKRDKKIGVVFKLHLFFIAEIHVVFQIRTMNKYSQSIFWHFLINIFLLVVILRLLL